MYRHATQLIATIVIVMLSGTATAKTLENFAEYEAEARMANVFDVPVAGETYDEFTGKIGHRYTDITLSGDGILGYSFIREHEEVPGAYPYAFGTMSVRTPRLDFEVAWPNGGYKSASNLNCHDWKTDSYVGGRVRNSITFTHENGSTELQSKGLATSAFSDLFPGDAFYVSTDFYYMKCLGARFEVYAPDGSRYTFIGEPDTQSSQPHNIYSSSTSESYRTAYYLQRNESSGTSISRSRFTHYRMHVAEKRKLATSLLYYYDDEPYRDNDGDGTQDLPQINAPLRSEAWFSAIQQGERRWFNYGSNALFLKKRLSKVWLATDGSTVRKLSIRYNSENSTCPGTISKVESPASPEVEILYHYSTSASVMTGVDTTPTTPELPESKCFLTSVTRADGSSWKFTYGLDDNPRFRVEGKQHYEPDVSTLYLYNTRVKVYTSGIQPVYRDARTYAYIPIRSVQIPTGAKVIYDYHVLGKCEYQDAERRDSYPYYRYRSTASFTYTDWESCKWGNSALAPRRLALSKRTIVGTGEPLRTTVSYKMNPAEYTVERWITNTSAQRTRRMIFGRVDRISDPKTSGSSVTGARLRDGGKLLEVSLHAGTHFATNTATLPQALTRVVYRYADRMRAFGYYNSQGWYGIDVDSNDAPIYWSELNSRNTFLYSARETYVKSRSVFYNGSEFVTDYFALDPYNFPQSIRYRTVGDNSPASEKRRYVNRFHNVPAQSPLWRFKPWIIGRVKRERVGDGHAFGCLSGCNNSLTLISRYEYDSGTGLLSYRYKNGADSTYSYYDNGNLLSKTTGSYSENHSQYKHGVAESIVVGGLAGSITRSVDERGNITAETDQEGRRTTYSYNNANQISTVVRPPPLGPVTHTYPNWHPTDIKARVSSEYQGGRVAKTYYDTLGRVRFTHLSSNQSTVDVFKSWKYDSAGDLKYESFPMGSLSEADELGTIYVRDTLGRVEEVRRNGRYKSSTTNAHYQRYCYGRDCRSSPFFSNLDSSVSIENGYAIKDADGFISTYEYRSHGSPDDSHLIRHTQQIAKNGEIAPQFGSGILSVDIDRNAAGFATRVSHYSNGTDVVRTFTPYALSDGHKTLLVGTEEHPELGSRHVVTRNSAGKETLVDDFDSSRRASVYLHGSLSSYDRVSAQGESLSGETRYAYDDSGLIISVNQGQVERRYSYDNSGLLSGESVEVAGGRSHGVNYTRDELGNIVGVVYPSARSVSIERDGLGFATGIPGIVSNVSRTSAGKISAYTLSNGNALSLNYDRYLRPRIREINNSGGERLLYDSARYSHRDYMVSLFRNDKPFRKGLQDIKTDGLGRLVSVVGTWGVADYAYDEMGNVRQSSVGMYDMQYEYDSNNRLTSTAATGTFRAMLQGSRALQYDARGNVVQHGDALYEFDGQDRLITSTREGFVQENLYDGLGLRAQSTVRANGGNAPSGYTTTTFHLYGSDGTLWHEFDEETGEMRDYIVLDGRAIAVVGKVLDDADSDGDGIPNHFERLYGTDVHRRDAAEDADGDGLSNRHEYIAGTSPALVDSDRDGVPDDQESITDIPRWQFDPAIEPVFDLLMNY